MSPSSQTYVAPVPLRRAAGFPDLGLLRELRPHAPPSPDFEGIAGPLPTGGCARVPTFRSTTHGPVDDLLYPVMLCLRAMMRRSQPCRRRDMPRPVQSADPDHAPCSPLSRCESLRISWSEASSTGFVFLIVDPAVARRGRDSALSGQLRPLCAFHHECRIALVICGPLSTLLISE